MAVAAEDFFAHIDKFMDYRKVVYETSDQTLKSNRTDLKLFRGFIENQAYPAIDGPAVMDFQYYLKKDRGNTGGSINRKIFTLRSYSHFLILQDVKDAHDLPFYDVLKVRQGYRNRPNALTIDQVKRLFEGIDRNTCLGIRDYAVYALMYQTGLRVGEVHTLDIPSIDFENQTLEVIGKGNKRRILHLTDEMVQILIEWLAVRNRFYKSNETDALFVSKKGNRLAIRTMEDNIKKIVRNSGIYARFNISCHTLRHSFASHLNDKDVDILVIQSLLGHTSPRSTEPYIHPSLEKVRESMERLPSVIFLNELVKDGILSFQMQYRKRE
jgi:site-specific recombinase XerD